MFRPQTCGTALFLAAALMTPLAKAQTPAAAEAAAQEQPAQGDDAPVEELEVDVLAPGGTITIVGRRDRNLQQSTTQVISVLSSEDIARTGEGDIAGALGRVTGLSVVRGGFVYVRGLGDRYSQALLNGLQLPSPEPLRRAVPLDLFPTDVIASSLVQKTYSANYPAEFGGGVINLTTLAAPKLPFLNISLGVSGDTFTTGQLGYDYFGSKTDWTGYDYGNRNAPAALKSYIASREQLGPGGFDPTLLAREFVNANNSLIQRIDEMPANYSGTISGGTSWMIGESQLGLIATAGTSNSWQTRDNTQQTAANADLSRADLDFRNVITENHVVNNALLGLSYEFGDGNRLRWTNLYIHDTLKRASLAEGSENNQRPGQDIRRQYSGWYERQILNTQVNGTFKFNPVTMDLRAAYAKSSREAPYELDMTYNRSNQAASPFGNFFINRLDNQTGSAKISFGDLTEELKSAGVDFSAELLPRTVFSAGFDYTESERDSTRREFLYTPPTVDLGAVVMLRPDYLLQPSVVDFYRIGVIETTTSDPAFNASLRTTAGYLQAQSELFDGMELSAGLRYEQGLQQVQPVQVFNRLTNLGASTRLDNDYVLPALTLTYKLSDNMQFRVHGSQTIARPQFRELMFQAYFDPETNRSFRGNPGLVDSEFTNAEARFEWYFAPEQRLSVAAFYKDIENPIESYISFDDNSPVTSVVNAPAATLYGVETEIQKYLPLEGIAPWSGLAQRRVVAIANYTWTDSSLDIRPGDLATAFPTPAQAASNFFIDGVPLSGQSDHLVNLQLGLEHPGRLSQQTLLFSWASDRVTQRGPGLLPDIYESPGARLDFVAREGIELFGQSLELKVEARNIFQRDYREFQRLGDNRIFYNRWDIGTSWSLSVTANF